MEATNIKISLLSVNSGQILGLPKNPRFIKDDRFEKLKKSISDDPEMMELREAIVYPLGDKFVIIGGNMRFRACKELGYKEMPCKVLAIETPPEKLRAYLIKDNANFGDWDTDLLANEFDAGELEAWGVETPGFDEDIVAGGEDNYTIPDKIKTDIVIGDLFEIGEHRLLCGDSTNSDGVDKLMNGEKAHMVFTDPPYGVSYAAKNEYLNTISRGNHIQEPIENDHMNIEDTRGFILLLFSQIKRILAERSSYYITAPQGGDLMMMMMMMMMEAGIPLRHCLIWIKNNHVLGRTDYNYKHEPILFGWDKVHDFYGNGDHKFSTWEIPKPLKNDLHPTMKPVALVENCLLNSTLPGMIVVDLCLGSGTTMVAAHQLKRKCYGMELSPEYCQVVIDRILKLDPTLTIKRNGVDITDKYSYNQITTNAEGESK